MERRTQEFERQMMTASMHAGAEIDRGLDGTVPVGTPTLWLKTACSGTFQRVVDREQQDLPFPQRDRTASLAAQNSEVLMARPITSEPLWHSNNTFNVSFPPPTWADPTRPTVKVGRSVRLRHFAGLPTLGGNRGPHGEEVSFPPRRRLVSSSASVGVPCQPSEALAEEGLPEAPAFDISSGSHHCAKISAANQVAGVTGARHSASFCWGSCTQLPRATLFRLGNSPLPVLPRFDCWLPGHPSTRATQPSPHQESPAHTFPTRPLAGRDHTHGMTGAGDSPSFAQSLKSWQAGLPGLRPPARSHGSEKTELMAWVIWITGTPFFFGN